MARHTVTDERLYGGSPAQLIIITADTTRDARPRGRLDDSVQVLRGGSAVDVQVTTGAVGAPLTEVLSGLSAGDEVILADRTADVVGDDSSGDSGLTGLSSDQGPWQRPRRGQPPSGGQPGAGPSGT